MCFKLVLTPSFYLQELHPLTAEAYTPLDPSHGGVCRYWDTDTSSNSWEIM